MARFRKRARHYFGKARKSYRKHRGFGGGMLGPVIKGGIIGAGVQFAGPIINSNIPQLGPFRPTTVAVGGVGLAGKLLHKGGGWADAALIIGAAMAAGDLMSGMGGVSTGGGSSAAYG